MDTIDQSIIDKIIEETRNSNFVWSCGDSPDIYRRSYRSKDVIITIHYSIPDHPINCLHLKTSTIGFVDFLINDAQAQILEKEIINAMYSSQVFNLRSTVGQRNDAIQQFWEQHK